MVARLILRLERQVSTPSITFAWDEAEEHCRIAHLRGLFLARGSLSLAAGRAHLEFVLPAEEAGPLAERLAGLGLPASARTRRGLGVVTWKGAETILRFLRLAGASASVLEVESRLVTRALRGELNRVINAEEANLERAVAAAARQRAAIDVLTALGRLGSLPDSVREVALARRLAPEVTIGELAARLGTTRSRVQRALERIEAAAREAQG